MPMTAAGLRLIKGFEGFVDHWYRDAVGVETCCYGHTAMAGPPVYDPRKTFTRDEGQQILDHDLTIFSASVTALVRVPLGNNQFSALTSFAYNIGIPNFAHSSVLRAINAGDFGSVPRLMSLWVKGRVGGQLRILSGLVRRRGAEGALFMTPDTAALSASDTDDTPLLSAMEQEECIEARGSICAMPDGSNSISSIVAAVATGAAGLAGWLRDGLFQIAQLGQWFGLHGREIAIAGAVFVLAGAAYWIFSVHATPGPQPTWRRTAIPPGIAAPAPRKFFWPFSLLSLFSWAFLPTAAINFLAAWWKPIAILVVVLGLFGGGYWKGHSAASAACNAAALQADLNAKQAELDRYKALLADTQKQVAQEQQDATDREKALAAELQQVSAERESDRQKLTDQITVLITDKKVLSDVLDQIAKHPASCVASPAVVAADKRLRHYTPDAGN